MIREPIDLEAVLYGLYHTDPNQFEGLDESAIEGIARTYSSKEIDILHRTMHWILANPAHPFSEIFPDLGYSNILILRYVRRIIVGYECARKRKKDLEIELRIPRGMYPCQPGKGLDVEKIPHKMFERWLCIHPFGSARWNSCNAQEE